MTNENMKKEYPFIYNCCKCDKPILTARSECYMVLRISKEPEESKTFTKTKDFVYLCKDCVPDEVKNAKEEYVNKIGEIK